MALFIFNAIIWGILNVDILCKLYWDTIFINFKVQFHTETKTIKIKSTNHIMYNTFGW